MAPAYRFNGRTPVVDATAFVHPSAVLTGAVTISAALGPVGRDLASALLRMSRGSPRGAATGPPRHAYLGPTGTFSESAARTLLEDGSELLGAGSVDAALQLVREGEATWATVPVENSQAGIVPATLDALAQRRTSRRLRGGRDARAPRPGRPPRRAQHGRRTPCRQPSARPATGRPMAPRTDAARRTHRHGHDRRGRRRPGREWDVRGRCVFPRSSRPCEPAHPGHGCRPGPPGVEDTIFEPDTPRAASCPQWRRPHTPDSRRRSRQSPRIASVLTELTRYDVPVATVESRPLGEGFGARYFYLECHAHITQPGFRRCLVALRRRHVDVRYLGSYPASPMLQSPR